MAASWTARAGAWSGMGMALTDHGGSWAGAATSGYAASLEYAKNAFRAPLERYTGWAAQNER
jgi:hypothetical protein